MNGTLLIDEVGWWSNPKSNQFRNIPVRASNSRASAETKGDSQSLVRS
jgi:hypothetical protein